MWTGHGFDKLRTEMNVPSSPMTECTVYLAKNETEGAHIAIRTDCDTGYLNFRVLSGNNEHITVNVYHVMEILELDGKQWTDPCAPLSAGKRFEIAKNETMAILAEFKTTVNTPEGDYEYELGVTDIYGNVIEKVKITVHVWDFEMPEGYKFQTAIGNHAGQVEHYKMLLDHNMSGYKLPYDILDERADAYMSDPRVTSFEIPLDYGREDNIERATAYYNKIKTNPVWLEKAYFYPVDEPSNAEQLEKFETRCKELRELFPGQRVLTYAYPGFSAVESQLGDVNDSEMLKKYIYSPAARELIMKHHISARNSRGDGNLKATDTDADWDWIKGWFLTPERITKWLEGDTPFFTHLGVQQTHGAGSQIAPILIGFTAAV